MSSLIESCLRSFDSPRYDIVDTVYIIGNDREYLTRVIEWCIGLECFFEGNNEAEFFHAQTTQFVLAAPVSGRSLNTNILFSTGHFFF